MFFLILKAIKIIHHFMFRDMKTYFHRFSGRENNLMVGSVIFHS